MKEHIEERIEVERYELEETPRYSFELTRRELLKVLGNGILVICISPTLLSSTKAMQRGSGAQVPEDVSAWIHISESGRITVYTGKVEVGQGVRTSLAQLVAEELKVPLSSIELVMGDTDLTPFDQGTFGSRTTPAMGLQLRRAAATARQHLINLAAQHLSVPAESLTAQNGNVVHVSSGRSLPFRVLTRGQKLVEEITSDVDLTPPGEWSMAGRSMPKVHAREIVTGERKFVTDQIAEGMLYGKVLRPPAFGARLISADLGGAEAMPGVVVVRDGDFIGVAAPTPGVAEAALAAIRAEWSTPPEQPSSETIFEHLRRTGEGLQPNLRLEEALNASAKRVSATYNVAYIAHVPLEPRAALALWEGDKLTVYTGTQRPFGVRDELANVFRIPREKVRVIVPETGSGYGGKHTGDAAVEAARLAKAAGRPVKVVWTREEEFTWAYFRPAGVIEIRAGLNGDGRITAWEMRNFNSGGAALESRYDVPTKHEQFHRANSPLRQGSYRALAATANHFARESHMDDLAREVGVDPLEFRLRHLSDERMRAVLIAAAERFDWENAAPNAPVGLGCGYDKGGYVATCAEIRINERTAEVEVVRVVISFECGAIVNPDNLKNQVEGAVIMGIGGALFEHIEFEGGKILNPRLSDYRVPRFQDVPEMDTVLLDRKDLPSAGAGETPIVAIAPAIGNAIARATGQRLRSLPLRMD